MLCYSRYRRSPFVSPPLCCCRLSRSLTLFALLRLRLLLLVLPSPKKPQHDDDLLRDGTAWLRVSIGRELRWCRTAVVPCDGGGGVATSYETRACC